MKVFEFIHDGTEDSLEDFIPEGSSEEVNGIPPQYCPISNKRVFSGHVLSECDAEPLKPYVEENLIHLDTFLFYWTSESGIVSCNPSWFENTDEVLPEELQSQNFYDDYDDVERCLAQRFENIHAIVWGYCMHPRGGVEYCEIVFVGTQKS